MDPFAAVILTFIGLVVGGVGLAVLLLRSANKDVERRARQKEDNRQYGNMSVVMRQKYHREKMARKRREDEEESKASRARIEKEHLAKRKKRALRIARTWESGSEETRKKLEAQLGPIGEGEDSLLQLGLDVLKEQRRVSERLERMRAEEENKG